MFTPTNFKKDKTNYIGLEIECIIPEDNYDDFFADKIMNPKLNPFCEIEDDGSIDVNMYEQSMEIKLIVTEETLEERLKILCSLFKKYKVSVNESCGFHVHLDCREGFNKLKELNYKLNESLPFLLGLVSRSRAGNEYCEPNVTQIRNEGDLDNVWGRFAINPLAYKKHQTIEIRLHSATTNFTKIVNWCRILKRIEKTEKIPEFKNMEDFVKKMEFEPDLVEYIFQRFAKHHSKKVKAA